MVIYSAPIFKIREKCKQIEPQGRVNIAALAMTASSGLPPDIPTIPPSQTAGGSSGPQGPKIVSFEI